MATIDKIHKEILRTAEKGLKKALNTGVKLAKEYIENKWYNSYQPKYYDRTGEILDSLDVSCKMVGNKIVGCLYVKHDRHTPSNSYGYQRTFAEIYDWFAEGEATGREGQELDALEYTKEQLVDFQIALDIINDELYKQGFILE